MSGPREQIGRMVEGCDHHNRQVAALMKAHEVGKARLLTADLIWQAFELGNKEASRGKG